MSFRLLYRVHKTLKEFGLIFKEAILIFLWNAVRLHLVQINIKARIMDLFGIILFSLKNTIEI